MLTMCLHSGMLGAIYMLDVIFEYTKTYHTSATFLTSSSHTVVHVDGVSSTVCLNKVSCDGNNAKVS